MELQGFRDLIVYKKSYKLALDIFEVTKVFPIEEKFSLTDQIRRSSRSIPANIAESWAKRIYTKAFVNKISDALGEEYETEVWLNMSYDLQYINSDKHNQILSGYNEIRKMLISILNSPEKFCK
ncbi:MAG: four helix bundle protein [Bacteroidales bacterium]|nr:four helix bundle protein [Bacteroidales bacterium]